MAKLAQLVKGQQYTWNKADGGTELVTLTHVPADFRQKAHVKVLGEQGGTARVWPSELDQMGSSPTTKAAQRSGGAARKGKPSTAPATQFASGTLLMVQHRATTLDQAINSLVQSGRFLVVGPDMQLWVVQPVEPSVLDTPPVVDSPVQPPNPPDAEGPEHSLTSGAEQEELAAQEQPPADPPQPPVEPPAPTDEPPAKPKRQRPARKPAAQPAAEPATA